MSVIGHKNDINVGQYFIFRLNLVFPCTLITIYHKVMLRYFLESKNKQTVQQPDDNNKTSAFRLSKEK